MEYFLVFLMVIMTVIIIAVLFYILINMPSRQQVLKLQREMSEEKSGREKCMEELNRFFVLVARMSLELEEVKHPRSHVLGETERASTVWERITEAYSSSELKQFTMDFFNLDLETIIPAGSLKEMALELVQYFQRRKELHKLVDALKKDRGGWEWKI
jgi:hypothetical protein